MIGKDLIRRYRMLERGNQTIKFLDPKCDKCRRAPERACIPHLLEVGSALKQERNEAIQAEEDL